MKNNETPLARSLWDLLRNNDIGAAARSIGAASESAVRTAADELFLLSEKERDKNALSNLIAAFVSAGRHDRAEEILEKEKGSPEDRLHAGMSYYAGNIGKLCRKNLYNRHKEIFSAALAGMGVPGGRSRVLSGEEHFLSFLFERTDGAVVFDVGAHTGEYALLVKKCRPDAVVHAFEPNPASFATLRESGRRHGFFAFNIGMSDKEENVDLYDDAGAAGSPLASLYPALLKLHGLEPKAGLARCATLDGFLAASDIRRVNLLRIDAGGHEYKILQGARDSLEMIDALHISFSEANALSRVFFKDLEELLPGYRWYRLLPDGLAVLSNESVLVQNLFAFQNLAALSPRISGRP